jgi:pimeloyl-ACP methyl ester carboxylesterase
MFPLTAVRTGPRGRTPLLVLPGGPGLASVLLYRSLRRAAAAAGFDVVMVEHRGVGLSRLDAAGADLPLAAMTVEQVVDDLAAVLDDAGIERAVVHGTSYGGYLAQAFGARHPARVAGMVLDSTGLSADDPAVARRHLRRVLLDGDGRGPGLLRELLDRAPDPAGRPRRPARARVRRTGRAGAPPRAAAAGRAERTWRWLAGLGAAEIEGGARYVAEPTSSRPSPTTSSAGPRRRTATRSTRCCPSRARPRATGPPTRCAGAVRPARRAARVHLAGRRRVR